MLKTIIIYSGKNNVLLFPFYKVKWRTRVSSKIKIAYLRTLIIPYTFSSTKILYFVNILSYTLPDIIFSLSFHL